MYYPSLSAVLAFLLVFRINMAYQRYWEGRTAMQTLLSKLGDIALHTKAFVLSEDHEARAWKDRMGESHRHLLRKTLGNFVGTLNARWGNLCRRTTAAAIPRLGHRVSPWRARFGACPKALGDTRMG